MIGKYLPQTNKKCYSTKSKIFSHILDTLANILRGTVVLKKSGVGRCRRFSAAPLPRKGHGRVVRVWIVTKKKRVWIRPSYFCVAPPLRSKLFAFQSTCPLRPFINCSISLTELCCCLQEADEREESEGKAHCFRFDFLQELHRERERERRLGRRTPQRREQLRSVCRQRVSDEEEEREAGQGEPRSMPASSVAAWDGRR